MKLNWSVCVNVCMYVNVRVINSHMINISFFTFSCEVTRVVSHIHYHNSAAV